MAGIGSDWIRMPISVTAVISRQSSQGYVVKGIVEL